MPNDKYTNTYNLELTDTDTEFDCEVLLGILDSTNTASFELPSGKVYIYFDDDELELEDQIYLLKTEGAGWTRLAYLSCSAGFVEVNGGPQDDYVYLIIKYLYANYGMRVTDEELQPLSLSDFLAERDDL